MKNVTMILAGGLGALFLLAALINGTTFTPGVWSSAPQERSVALLREDLRRQDAWLQFWFGGVLLIGAGVRAVWPERRRS